MIFILFTSVLFILPYYLETKKKYTDSINFSPEKANNVNIIPYSELPPRTSSQQGRCCEVMVFI